MLADLKKKDLDWLKPNSSLRHIIKSNLVMLTETADLERLVSVFSLQDSVLNQASKPACVQQMVMIQTESTSWQEFDAEAAVNLWALMKNRKVVTTC